MIYDCLVLMKELLADNGSIYVHCDWRVNSYVRLICDEVFGKKRFLNHLIWGYKTGGIPEKLGFSKKHDDVLVYTAGEEALFNQLTQKSYVPTLPEPHTESGKRLGVHRDTTCQLCGVGRPGQKYRNVIMRDVWDDIQSIFRNDEQGTGYATQKPEALLERIIKASSNEGDLVADFFCGSGTTLAVAEKLGRRWIGCDLSRFAIHVTRKRLLGIENCKPFEVLNLGKYERKYWQGITFGSKKQDQQLAIFEYLAFILRLYGAQPLTGMEHLHGKKGNAVIHVGAVDAPVTIDEINACLDECLAIKQKELHVLGWEWEMGLYDIITDVAKGRGIKLVLRTIPREVMEQQAAGKGDISFFELAYLEVDIQQQKRSQVCVVLKDFVIPNTELIREEVRAKVKKWSDYIDYWAVDWDFQNDTFVNGWVAYRTRRERTLALESDPHTYARPGRYTVMVKVVDIFGIDTSQAFEVEVR
ncbi:MAG: DNA adenine methyltransferase YhdJ [Firmicutes bacterium]|nr:DNA adenine methyltransferase YhdJ [Bacillota bacterium]